MRRMLFNNHTLMLYVPTIYLSVTRYYAHILFTFLYKLLYLHMYTHNLSHSGKYVLPLKVI